MSIPSNNDSIVIRDVWNYNLEDEFKLIRDNVNDYRYIGMDTEFPGIVLRSTTNFNTTSERNYENIKINVDHLKLIQLGLTLFDDKGCLPTCGTGKQCVWQFNFREFDPIFDIYAEDSIDLLEKSGINFAKNKKFGVDAWRFRELLRSSRVLVMNANVVWVTFHGGYDFAYLVKLLIWRSLPKSQEEFFKLIKVYFPVLYDIKHFMKYHGFHGGLNRLAKLLNLERVGTSHQAGSDSLLTCRVFIKLKEFFDNGSPKKYAGVLHGLGVEN